MRHPERAFDREQLLDRVWGLHVEGERTCILRLRKVLTPFDLSGWVQTVRGIGYRFSSRQATSPLLSNSTAEPPDHPCNDRWREFQRAPTTCSFFGLLLFVLVFCAMPPASNDGSLTAWLDLLRGFEDAAHRIWRQRRSNRERNRRLARITRQPQGATNALRRGR